MAASLGSFSLGLVVSLLAVSACSGSTGSGGNGVAGQASGASANGGGGSGGSVSRSGSGSGGSAARGGNASSGGSTSGGSASSGGSANSSGTGNATAGAAGTAGDSKACQSVDDCIIATVFGHTGCCARTDCGGGYNRAWVASEPCASADASADPVPASCSQGCALCPASVCPVPVGVLCVAGKCEAVTNEGPCTSDSDCALALDDRTSRGDCCSCPEVVSKAYDEAVECVTPVDAAKPAGCGYSGTCAGVSCPATCDQPTPVCKMGRCMPG